MKVVIPPSAVPQDEESIDLAVQVVEEQEVYIPHEYKPVSCFYQVHSSRDFVKPIDLHLEHNSVDDNDLVSLIHKEGSTTVSKPVLKDSTAVLQLLDSSNAQVMVIATKKETPTKRYATMLLYKHVPKFDLYLED